MPLSITHTFLNPRTLILFYSRASGNEEKKRKKERRKERKKEERKKDRKTEREKRKEKGLYTVV